MLVAFVQFEQAISHPIQVLLVVFPQYPVGQELRQIVEFGCRKNPGLQAEHWVLVSSKQSEQKTSQVEQIWFVVSFQYPVGQESRHIVVDGCRKYPGLQLEHWVLVSSKQIAQEVSQGRQM